MFPPTIIFNRYICIVAQAGRNENRKMTDKNKKDRNDGIGWKAVTRQDNWNMLKQEFSHRNRDREWILQDKKQKIEKFY